MEQVEIRTSMLIRRRPSEIFEAFVDPDILCRFWLDSASGALAPGAEVTWRFKVPGASESVTVTGFESPRRLALHFASGADAEFRFDFHDGDATRVSVRYSGLPAGDLHQIAGTAEGFSIVLCDLKTLLESGRSANLVRDKAELITREIAQRGPG